MILKELFSFLHISNKIMLSKIMFAINKSLCHYGKFKNIIKKERNIKKLNITCYIILIIYDFFIGNFDN
jgi:hypothetical protein